jgi:epoxyqueuosine reductase
LFRAKALILSGCLEPQPEGWGNSKGMNAMNKILKPRPSDWGSPKSVSISRKIIKSRAKEIGFDFCGIAPVKPLIEHRQFYTEFIKNKRHLSFSYLETNLEKRLDPRLILEDAKSVIAVLLNYYPPEVIPEEDNFIIAKYAYGKDYHIILKKKVAGLIHFITAEYPDLKAKSFIDSGPVMEKAWAQLAGLGWQGKNTLLINKNSGSFFFIGIILTNLELDPDQPEKDHCGECMSCINACPTEALSRPYQLDISRCISYHTIESKNEIPEALKDKIRDRIYGCDICQDVCPYNRFSRPAIDSARTPHTDLLQMRKKDWLSLTEEQFNNLFIGTPVYRTGYRRLMENIRFAATD